MGVDPTRPDQDIAVQPRSKPNNMARVKLRHGDRIDDRFTVVGRPLGKGGMGTVYKVQDDHGVTFAIKRLHPALQDEKRFVTRFEREYEAASTLRHPNIIAYQELFSTEGILHIRMEYNDGINLRQLLKQEKQLPLDMATSIGRDLARALEHLHAHRVVHRDIKPENILLDRHGSVKLTDFGISRFEYSTITRTGTLLGTPRYMSPEQLAGRKGEDISPASDLYALGMVLYEMLTGKDPYRIQKKAEILEVINIKQTKEAKPLPTEFDESLQQLVASLLQHDPSQRPESAREVGLVLGQWAASRNQQKRTFQEWFSQANGTKLTTTATRKRDSFWDTDKTSVDPEHQPERVEYIPAESKFSMLPIFLLTVGFLLALWGIGLWQKKASSPATSGPSTGTPKHPLSASSQKDRAFPLRSAPNAHPIILTKQPSIPRVAVSRRKQQKKRQKILSRRQKARHSRMKQQQAKHRRHKSKASSTRIHRSKAFLLNKKHAPPPRWSED